MIATCSSIGDESKKWNLDLNVAGRNPGNS
jgi:hypothetical protein